MKSKFPIYCQTTNYSCGASSALMVLNFFKKTKLSRSNEFELWKDMVALPFKFSSSFGLSKVLAQNGLKVKLISPLKDPKHSELKIPYEGLPKSYRKEAFRCYTFYRSVQINDAKTARVEITSREPHVSDITNSLKDGKLSIILVDDWWLSKNVWKDELRHVPHWVVVIGSDEDNVILADPECGRIKVPFKVLPILMDTRRHTGMQPVVIIVGKRPNNI